MPGRARPWVVKGDRRKERARCYVKDGCALKESQLWYIRVRMADSCPRSLGNFQIPDLCDGFADVSSQKTDDFSRYIMAGENQRADVILFFMLDDQIALRPDDLVRVNVAERSDLACQGLMGLLFCARPERRPEKSLFLRVHMRAFPQSHDAD